MQAEKRVFCRSGKPTECKEEEAESEAKTCVAVSIVLKMGCTHSDFVVATKNALNPTYLNRYKNTENAELTGDQIQRVKSSWKLITNHREFGLNIMTRIFTKHLEVKHKWIFAKDLNNEDEIRKNPQLIYHATKIMEIMDKVITSYNYDSVNDFKDIMHLGKNHYDYGVRPSDFEHFEEALIYCLDKEIKNDKIFDLATKASWKKFFMTLASKLSEGIYLAEIDELNTINNCKRKTNF